MTVEIGGQCDGFRLSRAEGNALIGLGIDCIGLPAPKDSVCLSAGAAVGDVDTSTPALVCCGSRLEEGFQRARDPGTSIFKRGRGREDRCDDSGESEAESKKGSERAGRFKRHNERLA